MYKKYNQINKRNVFFGKNNYSDYGRFVTYKSVLSDEEIILRTNNISYIHTGEHEISDVLIVDDNKYVYLKPWQVLKIKYRDEKGEFQKTYLVKLNRLYFKAYYSKESFPNIRFETADNFDSLYEHARLQGLRKLKVEII